MVLLYCVLEGLVEIAGASFTSLLLTYSFSVLTDHFSKDVDLSLHYSSVNVSSASCWSIPALLEFGLTTVHYYIIS